MTLVTVEQRDGTRILTMDRPEARNAMDSALLGALLEAFGDAVGDEAVRVVVLTGAGGAFSAGADVKEVLDHAGTVRRMELFGALYEAVATSPTPTVAAITGPCVGGGVEVAAACDIRVAAPTARFRFPGAALGIPVGAAKLVGLVGLGTAKELVLTSRTFAADEAARIGFVQQLRDDALEGALEVAAAIAANHPEAVAALKRQFLAYGGQGDRVAAEHDVVRALAEAGGDYRAVTAPQGSGGWAGGAWRQR